MDSTQLKSSPSDPSSRDFQGQRAMTNGVVGMGMQLRGEKAHARTHAHNATHGLGLELSLGILRDPSPRTSASPARQIVNIAHFGGCKPTSYGDGLQLNFGLHRFALKSVLWLRLTRHFVLKPPRRRRRQKTLFGKWLRHILCFVLGWATDECWWPGKACSVGLSKCTLAFVLSILNVLLTTSKAKSTLACGVGQVLAGVKLLPSTWSRYWHPLTNLLPPAAKSLTFILSPVHGPSCRHANLVRVLATQRAIRNLCPRGLSRPSHP
ncbi:hypothetical protein TrVFT333_011527 [Trichoderma virens FT-333]|nr:hypothetical protein TrVFT333_011527 [Trichoderma virens FT-333]